LLNIGNQYVIITSYFLSDLDLSAATANILTSQATFCLI